MAIHPQKIESIIKLTAEDRYWYSIREIAKFEVVWLVSGASSLMTIVDEEGDEILPIWPHREVAELCMLDEMKNEELRIEPMDLLAFLNECIPDLGIENIFIGVFYDRNRTATAVPLAKFRNDIEMEMEG